MRDQDLYAKQLLLKGNEYLLWDPQPQWHFIHPSAPDEFLVSSFHEYLDVFDRDSLYDANI